jgi:hypothetical protein
MAKGDNPKLALDQQTVSHLKAAMESAARADQQTVSHLKGPLGIPGKVERQMTVAHLAQPLGANPGSGSSQSGPAPKPATPSQGAQGGGKK